MNDINSQALIFSRNRAIVTLRVIFTFCDIYNLIEKCAAHN